MSNLSKTRIKSGKHTSIFVQNPEKHHTMQIITVRSNLAHLLTSRNSIRDLTLSRPFPPPYNRRQSSTTTSIYSHDRFSESLRCRHRFCVSSFAPSAIMSSRYGKKMNVKAMAEESDATDENHGNEDDCSCGFFWVIKMKRKRKMCHFGF